MSINARVWLSSNRPTDRTNRQHNSARIEWNGGFHACRNGCCPSQSGVPASVSGTGGRSDAPERRLTCSCDRRSPLTLASVQICATDRPTDREIFPFEQNAGVAFRSRTQTISHESNVRHFGVLVSPFRVRSLLLRKVGATWERTNWRSVWGW